MNKASLYIITLVAIYSIYSTAHSSTGTSPDYYSGPDTNCTFTAKYDATSSAIAGPGYLILAINSVSKPPSARCPVIAGKYFGVRKDYFKDITFNSTDVLGFSVSLSCGGACFVDMHLALVNGIATTSIIRGGISGYSKYEPEITLQNDIIQGRNDNWFKWNGTPVVAKTEPQVTTTCSYNLMADAKSHIDLYVGSNNAVVRTLQQILNSDQDTMIATSGPGSKGLESTYFGYLTKQAVIKFQKKYSITPAAGFVGPKTRAQLNMVCTSV